MRDKVYISWYRPISLSIIQIPGCLTGSGCMWNIPRMPGFTAFLAFLWYSLYFLLSFVELPSSLHLCVQCFFLYSILVYGKHLSIVLYIVNKYLLVASGKLRNFWAAARLDTNLSFLPKFWSSSFYYSQLSLICQLFLLFIQFIVILYVLVL